uniref:Protein phosphatase, Mg2+/Mn2+ dependent 1J n=1 Tax=Chelonoidis abingdonii TaxID=106734 RepID=A0A8C0H9V2_CHEAB
GPSACRGPPVGGGFSRPAFLQLTSEELQLADDHAGRAVQSPRESRRRLPWSTGYAEKDLCFHYWGLFDGHAGSGAAVMASKLLHLHICDQLRDLVDILQDSSPPPLCLPGILPSDALPRFHLEKAVSHESLVIGAIENAFKRMDEQIERERMTRLVAGGCCALAVVYLLGKVYVANAGDSRAIIIRNGEIIPMSREFTPETERQRLQFLGFLRPELLGNEFTHLEFPRRIQHKELGKKMLYRDQNMNGWAYKRIEEDDLKFPLIYGEGKKARVMATIGVTRGLGDHDLKVYNSNIHIKPFLSCVPEVRVYDLTQYEHCPDDVLVLGTDGLWDVTNDREVADVVKEVLMDYEPNDPLKAWAGWLQCGGGPCCPKCPVLPTCCHHSLSGYSSHSLPLSCLKGTVSQACVPGGGAGCCFLQSTGAGRRGHLRVMCSSHLPTGPPMGPTELDSTP